MLSTRNSSRALAGVLSVGLALVAGAARSAPPAAQAPPADRENLARDKPATASSAQDDSRWAGAATDGEPGTRWCAADGSFPQWVQVDLGRPETLTGCRIDWETPEASYAYRVEGSPDGQAWATLIDASKPDAGGAGRVQPFGASGVRFVRLTVAGAGLGRWASLHEFAVFGTGPAPAVLPAARQVDRRAILREVKVPPGFEAAIFAAPPDVRYPTCLAAAPTGEVFVGVDENSSLDAKADRGRVVRCVDADGDGAADRFDDFVVVDSPRGLAWDAGTLYVLHPPLLTAYRDTDGDGKADRSVDLVRGIGFDLKHRGADHTTNGIRLAIDGFLYVAVGDYGFVAARGADGPPLPLLGGGVVRVRTDGTGLEIVSRGQRNIYDVAIDPAVNLFTRDNTNDGDGWDVRLSHVVPTGHYGYPSLFKRFADEAIAPLADYGGGSPCGSLFLQEPGFPAGFGNTLYTCEWGRGAVFMHPLKPRGASFEAGQETFATIPRPTDMDVDGSGRIFISSWRDGGFNYSKPTIGFVARVVAAGSVPRPFPDLAQAPPAALVEAIRGDSAVLRLAAQRELLRRGVDDAAARLLEAAVAAPGGRDGRIAAVFTLAQGRGAGADEFLVGLARANADLREFAVAALGDRRDPAARGPQVAAAVGAALGDPDPRVRLAALVAAGRLGPAADAPVAPILRLAGDADPVVAHAAVRALVKLHSADACLDALAATADAAAAPGVGRALQEMHDPAVVVRLAAIAAESGRPIAQRAALRALCRLYFAEAPYEAGKWWGTRPDTAGPYYKPITWAESEAVGRALRDSLRRADPELSRWLLGEMVRNRLDFDETTPQAAKLAATDPALRASVLDLMAARPRLSGDATAFLAATAADPAVEPATRARALRGLLKHQNQGDVRQAALGILAAVGADDRPDGDLRAAWTEYVKDGRRAGDLASFVKLAEGDDAPRGTLGWAVLVVAAGNPKTPEAAKALAIKAIDRGWYVPARAPRLLRAVGLVRADDFAPKVRELLGDDRTEVRQAAEFAAGRLGLAAPAAAGSAPKAGPTARPIAATSYDLVLAAALADPGDAALGGQLFERQGCVNCHAVAKAGPIKGPYLGDVAARYSRAELVESILKPSARIAQGFETQKIATNDGRTVEGFVVREAGDEVELRNSAGSVVTIAKKEIEERGKGELSVMPQGLMDPLTPHDLASLLAYLESIRGK